MDLSSQTESILSELRTAVASKDAGAASSFRTVREWRSFPA